MTQKPKRLKQCRNHVYKALNLGYRIYTKLAGKSRIIRGRIQKKKKTFIIENEEFINFFMNEPQDTIFT